MYTYTYIRVYIYIHRYIHKRTYTYNGFQIGAAYHWHVFSPHPYTTLWPWSSCAFCSVQWVVLTIAQYIVVDTPMWHSSDNACVLTRASNHILFCSRCQQIAPLLLSPLLFYFFFFAEAVALVIDIVTDLIAVSVASPPRSLWSHGNGQTFLESSR